MRILHVPFKSGVCFQEPSSSPKHKLHWFSKPDILGAALPGAGPPGWGAQCGGWTPCSLGAASVILIILPFLDYLLKDVGLTSTTYLLLLLVLLQSLLYFFSWGKSVRLQVVFINCLLCK